MPVLPAIHGKLKAREHRAINRVQAMRKRWQQAVIQGVFRWLEQNWYRGDQPGAVRRPNSADDCDQIPRGGMYGRYVRVVHHRATGRYQVPDLGGDRRHFTSFGQVALLRQAKPVVRVAHGYPDITNIPSGKIAKNMLYELRYSPINPDHCCHTIVQFPHMMQIDGLCTIRGAWSVDHQKNPSFYRYWSEGNEYVCPFQSTETAHPEQYLLARGAFVALTFMPQPHNVNGSMLIKFHI
jgi:hypothetical protein